MSFTITHVRANNIALTDIERTLIDEKLAVLDKFIGDETAYTCDVEVKHDAHHLKGNVYTINVTLVFRGDTFRAEAHEETLSNALDIVRNEIKASLSKAKSKHHTYVRKGAILLKKIFGRA